MDEEISAEKRKVRDKGYFFEREIRISGSLKYGILLQEVHVCLEKNTILYSFRPAEIVLCQDFDRSVFQDVRIVSRPGHKCKNYFRNEFASPKTYLNIR